MPGRLVPLLLVAMALAGCTAPGPVTAPSTLQVTSAAFAQDQPIPKVHTCQGANTSPPLRLAGAPANAAAYAMIMDDPDAPNGTFTHWIFWNLPLAQGDLPTGADMEGRGAVQGLNGARIVGYRGPCPPSGTHHYHFRAYALDRSLELSAQSNVDQLRQALQGHVLAQGDLVGTYVRE